MFVGGEGLQPSATATTVRIARGRRPDRLRRPLRRDQGAARRLLPARLQGPRRRARLGQADPDARRHGRGPAGHGLRGRRLRGCTRTQAEARGRRSSAEVADRLFRRESGRAVATLIRILGDFDLAEEAVQEAFVVALERWPRDGLPDNPGAWIVRTARNRAIDRIRRERRYERQAARARSAPDARSAPRRRTTTSSLPDDRLRLFFTCCHPALAPEAQVALTLRTLGGLSTPEVARAFLVAESHDGSSGSSARSARSAAPASPTRCPPDSRAARAAALGAGRALPDLQRGLPRDERRHPGAARAVRRGDPPGARAGAG